MAPHAYRVITHIHSRGSNALASNIYGLVTGFVKVEFGAAAPQVSWSECETTASDLEAILDGRRTRRPVDLLFLTDHMSPRSHVLERTSIELACRNHRLGIGAEIQTCLPDGTGGWVVAPEVLVYGAAEAQPGSGGRYYGLTQEQLDAAFDTCTPPGAPLPHLERLHEFLKQHRLACALAHPLDGHELAVPQLLAVLREFDFFETVNGGYSQVHARLLSRTIDALRRHQQRDGREGRHPQACLVALGGSDAHLNNFDRVVTLFSHNGPPPDAGVFIAAMLEAPEDPVRARLAFVPSGRGIGTARLSWEVLTLVVRNFRKNAHLLANRLQLAAAFKRGIVIATREFRGKLRAASGNDQELGSWLDGSRQDGEHARSPRPSDAPAA